MQIFHACSVCLSACGVCQAPVLQPFLERPAIAQDGLLTTTERLDPAVTADHVDDCDDPMDDDWLRYVLLPTDDTA
jgi:hypothetical protein